MVLISVNKLLENLIGILQLELSIYEELLELGEKKTGFLVTNDIEQITAITKEENKAAIKTRELGKAREQTLEQLCRITGDDHRSVTLSRVSEISGETYKKSFQVIGDKLFHTIMKLKARNEINQNLIENAISYINFNMQLISSPRLEATSYGPNGKEVSSTDSRAVLDLKY